MDGLTENLLEENISNSSFIPLIKDSFILKLYYYYVHKGYYNIISTKIVNMLTIIFLFGFIIFSFNCVDYSGLFDLDKQAHIGDYLDWNNFFNLDVFSWICLSLFGIYILCNILSLIDDIKVYYPVKKFYNNKLFIADSQIISIKWEEIIKKINEVTGDDNLDIYLVTNKIMAKDNYLISIIDKDVIKLRYMTKLMEWNIKYCIIHAIFDDKNRINKELFDHKEQYTKNIIKKMRMVSIANYLFMPLIFIFVTFYSIFKYGEIFYNNPNLIASRHWTMLSMWKFREYNELYHIFMERTNKGLKPSIEYINQFPSKLLETFAKLIVFVLSSLFIMMLFLTLVNENLLLNLYISSSRPILWYMGILGTIIAISKAIIKDKFIFYPKEKLKEIHKHIGYIPEDWIDNADKLYVKNKFVTFFEYQIVTLLKDIFYVLGVPFELWNLSYTVKDVVNFIIDNTTYDVKLGYICSSASFKKITQLEYQQGDKKTVKSFESFKRLYPDWIEQRLSSESASINVINMI